MTQNTSTGNQVLLDVHGCRFRLSGNSTSALDMLANDFQFFIKNQVDNPIEIRVITGDPPYSDVPQSVATTYTPRNVSFTHEGRTYVDYSGRALAIRDRSDLSFEIHSRSHDVQYEATYLFLLSCIGETLDQQGMHRIHAMAMSVKNQAVLAILPMGGGKSTLGSGLLKYPEFKFLSDDSPFISSDGRVHAFPLRLGLLPGFEQDIPEDQRRTIQRMEFGPKVLVNYEYFADRVIPSADPGIVFLGLRSLAEECIIEPAGSWEGLKSMSVNCVVGLGLYQGLEFVLSHSPVELLSKSGIAWSRLRNARKLFAKSQVYRLILGRDTDQNAATVREFVNKHLG